MKSMNFVIENEVMINEFCDWKWSDDQWISSCNDVSQNVNLGLHTKCCKIRVKILKLSFTYLYMLVLHY